MAFSFPRAGVLPGVVLGIAMGTGLSLALGVYADKFSHKTSDVPLEELQAFTQIYNKIKTDYVKPVPDKKLMEGAINGMVESLDPHSAYLTPDLYKEIQIVTDGKFGGLGIEVSMDKGFVKVVSPIDDTPASRAGLKANDIIAKIDNTMVQGLTLQQAVDKMRGKPGTKINLTVLRKGQDKPLNFTLTREEIRVESVKAATLAPGYGYVRIAQFQQQTGRDLDNALAKLLRDNGGKLKGLVLDLRNNPGGVLNAAVDVSNTFLDKGKMIVYTKGRLPDSDMQFRADNGEMLKGTPIILLINEGSASASEIVAGALQDNKRVTVAGMQSFGKGSVQTVIPITSDSALKLTTALYYTPKGRSIQARGIVPDVEIKPLDEEGKKSDMADFLREADLTGHLNVPATDSSNAKDTKDNAPDGLQKTGPIKEKSPFLIKPSPSDLAQYNAMKAKEKDVPQSFRKGPDLARDFQLREALDMLKGTAVYVRSDGKEVRSIPQLSANLPQAGKK